MGILKFHGQLIKHLGIEYHNAPTGSVPTRVSGMMIDLNDLLHFFAQMVFQYGDFENIKPIPASKSNADLEKEMIKRLLGRLDFYLEEISPEDYFIAAVDGPAPLAKIQQQRKRRYEGGGKMTTDRFDSAYLSPGTELMEKIHLALERWFQQRYKEKRLPPFACYSSFHQPGEGEHKMIEILLRNERKIAEVSGAREAGLHLIAGQDSDLLMLGSMMPQRYVIHYREDRKEEAKTGEPTATLLLVDLFRSYVYKSFLRDRCILDYVLAYFVFGNDFIPKNPALTDAVVTMNDLSKAYIQNGKRLVDNKTGKINRSSFISFLQYLAPVEIDNLKVRATEYDPKKDGPFPLLVKNIPPTKKSGEGRQKVLDVDGFKKDWYKRCFDCYQLLNEHNPNQPKYISVEEMKQDMMENYFEMLQWNLDYYMRNKNISWNFQYRFFFPPFLSDLALLPSEGEIPRRHDETRKDVSILRQLLMIIHPKRIEDFVPKQYALLLDEKPLKNFSPAQPMFFEDGHPARSRHQYVSLLPLVDNESYDKEIFKLYHSEPPARLRVKDILPVIYVSSVEGKKNEEMPKIISTAKYEWTDEIVN